jgi:hypothetical protein
MGSEVQECIFETRLHRKHMLGIFVLSSNKRFFHSTSCWSHIWVKHQISYLAWTIIYGSFCCTHHRFFHILGHHQSNGWGMYMFLYKKYIYMFFFMCNLNKLPQIDRGKRNYCSHSYSHIGLLFMHNLRSYNGKDLLPLSDWNWAWYILSLHLDNIDEVSDI